MDLDPNVVYALWIVFGFVFLFGGGELVVRGAVNLAKASGVSLLFIGLVIVALGTSSPELVIALEGAFAGKPDIAMGNVIGSNIANIMLVLAVGAMVYPIAANGTAIWRDGTAVLAATGFLIIAAVQGQGGLPIGGAPGTVESTLSQSAGLVLLVGLVLYMTVAYFQESRRAGATIPEKYVEIAGSTEAKTDFWHVLSYLALVAIGIIGLIIGADRLIFGAVSIANNYKISEAVIAVSVIAVGTSLPELFAVIVACWRKHTDVALGTILGSNILNILMVLGVTASLKPLTIDGYFLTLDLWVMLAATVAFVIFLRTGKHIYRYEGLALLLGYFAYIGFIVYSGRLDNVLFP